MLSCLVGDISTKELLEELQVPATLLPSLRKVLKHNSVHRDTDAFKLPPALGFKTKVPNPRFRSLKAFIWRQLLVCPHFPSVAENLLATEKHNQQQYTLKLIKFGSEAAGSSLITEHRFQIAGLVQMSYLGSFAHRIGGTGSWVVIITSGKEQHTHNSSSPGHRN